MMHLHQIQQTQIINSCLFVIVWRFYCHQSLVYFFFLFFFTVLTCFDLGKDNLFYLVIYLSIIFLNHLLTLTISFFLFLQFLSLFFSFYAFTLSFPLPLPSLPYCLSLSIFIFIFILFFFPLVLLLSLLLFFLHLFYTQIKMELLNE